MNSVTNSISGHISLIKIIGLVFMGVTGIVAGTPSGSAAVDNFTDYVYITNISFGGSVSDIFLRGNVGFVILRPEPGPLTTHRLVIVNLSNPIQPAEISHIDYTVPYSSWGNAPTQIEVVGDFAYIANWHGGLQIIDVSNISSPQLRGYYHQNVVDWGEAMEGIVVNGNYAYTGWDYSYGLGVFNISNPDSPKKIANYGGISFARYVEKYGNYVYVSTYYGSYVRIFDVSNPSLPQLVGSIPTPGYTYYLGDVEGSKLYLSGNREAYGLKIYELSANPSNPSLLGQIETSSFGDAYNIKVNGGIAFQVYSNNLLGIFDISNPSSIQLLKTVEIKYSTGTLAVSEDNFIYLPQGDKGLGIVGIPYRVIPAVIDIKPGSYPNNFNNNENGVIPVAVLGNEDFNVREIKPDTVTLEGLKVKAVGKGNKLLAHYEDINGDGYEDLVIQIEYNDTVFSEGCTTAKLSGNLIDEILFEGTDEICIVP